MIEDKASLQFLHLPGIPIFEQLRIEEALLRASSHNWCIINEGSPETSIVMGISHKANEVVSYDHYSKNPIPLIRRFSGGGTVVVDQDTLFFTLILSDDSLLKEIRGPKELMKWTHSLIAPAFLPHQLDLEENDFAINKMKVGGNAQSFIRGRVLHHTSFLWNWSKENMDLLAYPRHVPEYRQRRDHASFCGKLVSLYPSKKAFIEGLQRTIMNRFELHSHSLESETLCEALKSPHRKSLELLSESALACT